MNILVFSIIKKIYHKLTGLCSSFFRNHSENFRRESLSHEAPTDQISEKINHGSSKSPKRSVASGGAGLSD
jgi:hypothetical protein